MSLILVAFQRISIAQTLPLTPDSSLGTESSILIPETGNALTDFSIEGGAIRENNLFHSFSDFNVNVGQQVQFRPDAGIEAIFTRVTGNVDSQILGRLGISGNADLFLINPNGIFFGPDAKFDLNGSFLASTADGIQFSDEFIFSTQTQEAPPQNLLDIQPSALFFSRLNPSPITSQAQLKVPFGESFQLVGGAVRIEDRNNAIVAREGLIELAGLAAPGTISLSTNGRLQILNNTALADVTLVEATINVADSQDGDINIYGDDVLLDGARIIAGYRERRNVPDSQAGDITINATGDIIAFGGSIANNLPKDTTGNSGNIFLIAGRDIRLNNARIQSELRGTGDSGSITIRAAGELFVNGARILNVLASRGQGNSGNIDIAAASLRMETPLSNPKIQQAQISTDTEGQGNAGSIFIEVDQLTMVGPGISGASGITSSSTRDRAVGNAGSINIRVNGPMAMTQRGKIESVVQGGATGNGGNVVIDAQSLTISDNSSINVQNKAFGEAGNILINLAGDLQLTDASFIDAFVQGAGAGHPSGDPGTGHGTDNSTGNIIINANSLSLSGRGIIRVSTSAGAGNAGRIEVNADSIEVEDTFVLGQTSTPSSGFFSRSRPDAEGEGGDIVLNIGLLRLSENSVINAATESDFSGGDLNITAERIELIDGGQIIASTFGQGDAGRVDIRASEQVLILGNDPIFAIQVANAERLLREGKISDLRQVINRVGANGLLSNNNAAPSGLFVSAQPLATGDAGESAITTDTLIVENGAQISANNFGSGSGRRTDINVRQLLIQDGGTVGAGSLVAPDSSDVAAAQVGPGGTLIVNASERIEVSGSGVLGEDIVNSQLFTRAEGGGPAGDLIINEVPGGSLRLVVRDQAEINASSRSSTGGEIFINNPDIVLLRTGGRITAEAGQSQDAGDGGNITLFMPEGFVITVPNENSDIVANAFAGTGGNINITAQSIFNLVERALNDRTNDINASSQFGQSGTVVINNLNLDPTQDLIELPTNTTPPTVAQRCLADSDGQSAFVITGQGGAPPTPRDVIRNESAGLIDLGDDTLIRRVTNPNNTTAATANDASGVAPISPIEAQSWHRDQAGDVVLIAPTPHPGTTPYLAVCAQVRR